MTKSEKLALAFLAKHPGKWHSFATDLTTVDTLCAMHNRGDCRVNSHTEQVHSTAQGLRNAEALS